MCSTSKVRPRSLAFSRLGILQSLKKPSFYSTSRSPIHDLGRSLVKTAAEPFFRILTKWIHRGSVEDPGKDFFVEDNEVIERAVLPLEYSDDYWEKRYTIKPDLVSPLLMFYLFSTCCQAVNFYCSLGALISTFSCRQNFANRKIPQRYSTMRSVKNGSTA